MKKYILLTSIICFSISIQMQAQDKYALPNQYMLNFSYGFGYAYADLADRFKDISTFGFGLEYLPGQSRLGYFIEAEYLYSQNVYEDVLKPLRVSGYIIGNDRGNAIASLDMNGLAINIGSSYFIPFKSKKALNGIKLSLGLGYIYHKVRIQDDTKSIVQLNNEYIKGYDRLSGGLSIKNQIAYRYLSFNRKINFEIGFKNLFGFTKSLRGYQYDLRAEDIDTRIDNIASLYARFSIPVYRGIQGDEFYY